MRKRIVGVVACSSSKADVKGKVPAFLLYSKSDLFNKAADYAEAFTDEWVILSAKHGVIDPGELIENYNERLPAGGSRIWAEEVARELVTRYGKDVKFIVLAGAAYRKHLFDQDSKFDFEVPLEGMGIGRQKQWLKRQVE